MSIDVGYYFNCELPIHELACQVEQAIGSVLTLDSTPNREWRGTIYRGRLFGMDLRLGDDLDYDDVGEVNFKDYRYELCNVARSGPLSTWPIQVEAIALSAFAM